LNSSNLDSLLETSTNSKRSVAVTFLHSVPTMKWTQSSVGENVGVLVGEGEGKLDGDGVGTSVGDGVGTSVGDGVGTTVGV